MFSLHASNLAYTSSVLVLDDAPSSRRCSGEQIVPEDVQFAGWIVGSWIGATGGGGERSAKNAGWLARRCARLLSLLSHPSLLRAFQDTGPWRGRTYIRLCLTACLVLVAWDHFFLIG